MVVHAAGELFCAVKGGVDLLVGVSFLNHYTTISLDIYYSDRSKDRGDVQWKFRKDIILVR